MDNKVYFTEEQRFRKPWVAVALFLALAAWIYAIYMVVSSPGTSEGTGSLIILLVTGIVPVLFIFLYFQVKLITEVKEDGVYYKFYPIQFKFRKLEPEEIEKYYLREYRPIREYGGWGIRTIRLKYGTAYNVSGKTGMQFELKSGKKFLLGTQRGEAFKQALDKWHQQRGTA